MNYYAYFSEVEERFLARRGAPLILSPLDWALIETWREAGVPLEAVLRGIDAAFDKHDARRASSTARLRKVNGLAWCAQAVMQATEEAVDTQTGTPAARPPASSEDAGFGTERVAEFLRDNARMLRAARLPAAAAAVRDSTAQRLDELAASAAELSDLPALDRTLSVLEEKLIAAVQAAAPEADLVDLRTTVDREMTAFRGRMNALQLRHVREQLLLKRLLMHFAVPRLSLFYMGVA